VLVSGSSVRGTVHTSTALKGPFLVLTVFTSPWTERATGPPSLAPCAAATFTRLSSSKTSGSMPPRSARLNRFWSEVTRRKRTHAERVRREGEKEEGTGYKGRVASLL